MVGSSGSRPRAKTRCLLELQQIGKDAGDQILIGLGGVLRHPQRERLVDLPVVVCELDIEVVGVAPRAILTSCPDPAADNSPVTIGSSSLLETPQQRPVHMISVSGVSMRFGSKVLFEDVTTTFPPGGVTGSRGPTVQASPRS